MDGRTDGWKNEQTKRATVDLIKLTELSFGENAFKKSVTLTLGQKDRVINATINLWQI